MTFKRSQFDCIRKYLEKWIKGQSKVNDTTSVGLAVIDLVGFALEITFLSLPVLTQSELEFSRTNGLEKWIKGQSKVNDTTSDGLAVIDLVGYALGITFLSLPVLTQSDFEFSITLITLKCGLAFEG